MVLGFGKRGPDSVGCYGKLPLHGDYLSHGSDGPEARRLTAWFDAGYRLTRGSDSLNAAGTGFILPGLGKRTIYGGFWPSGDKSGTRRFPFTLFAAGRTKPLAQLGALAPLALVRMWDTISAAMPGLRAAGTVDKVTTIVSGITMPALPSPEEAAAEFARASEVPALVARAKPSLLDVVRLTAALKTEKKAPPFAVRIPLTTQYSAAAETVAWLTILSRRLDHADLAAESQLFVRPPKGHETGELFVIHRELRPDDLGFVLHPTEDYPYGNLLGEDDDDPDNAEFFARFDEAAGENPTLAKFVETACGEV
jgi:type VI secretion system ImpM family protein